MRVSTDAIRAAFSEAMSEMYRQEVPLYDALIDIVDTVNRAVRSSGGGRGAGEADLARIGSERHGAIRVGTAAELAALRRVFAVMGLFPVDYYDLSVAGVPVHSTAFRPIDARALDANPFRIFTSLLRLDLIVDEDLRTTAAAILAARKILSDRAMALTAIAERHGGLTRAEADEFVAEVVETFRWQGDALVDAATYARLNGAHRLVADVVSFKGPHINHLTPRTLDIDAAQAEMRRRGIDAKDVIEGPPPRAVPLLLRQTSFKALEETVRFAGDEGGSHTARFGEIEQRGIALTPSGRALYDRCLDQARGAGGSTGADYERRLAAAFARFPDDLDELRVRGLAFFRYAVTPAGLAAAGTAAAGDVAAWIEAGWVVAEPIVYEDFLPVSAAGIFQSNLGGEEQRAFAGRAARHAFEQALGAPILDPFDLYAGIEAASLEAVGAALGGRLERPAA